MKFLGSKRYLGVDIGSSGVRVVEIENKDGKAKLVNYGYVDLADPIDLSLASVESEKIVLKALVGIRKEAGFSTRKTFGAIPGFLTVNRTFNFDKSTPDSVIRLWVEKNIISDGFLGKDVVVNWQRIGKNGKSRSLTILASAVSKDLIRKYKTVFKKADLRLLGLETVYHSLARSLVGYDNCPTLVVDIGESFTDFLVVCKGVPYVLESVEFGGGKTTALLAKNLHIEKSRAEQFKKDYHLFFSARDKNSFLYNEVWLYGQSLELEVKKVWSDFLRKFGGIKIGKVILTGGCSRDENLFSFFEKSLGIKAFAGDPWGRIICRREIRPMLNEIAPQFSVAAGAAMKGLE
jgi:Tfp pilus assembly PilM family ATPase